MLDSNNISRNLYLATQIIELGIPTIFALNMIDLLQSSNKQIDANLLKDKLGAYDIITCCALNSKGLIDLTQSITGFFNSDYTKESSPTILDKTTKDCLSELKDFFIKKGFSSSQSELYAINTVSNSKSLDLFETNDIKPIESLIDSVENKLEENNITPKSLNSIIRYTYLEKLFDKHDILIDYRKTKEKSFTEKLDKYLTHPIAGTGIFLCLLFLVFWTLFKFAEYPMNLVDSLMGAIKDFSAQIIPDGIIEDLVVNGILEGIGGIVIFIPQILILKT